MLEFIERLDQFRPEHLGKKFGASLTVAMFAGKRSAVTHHQIGGLVHELPEARNALLALVVEVRAGMHAGVAEVAVERAVIAELAHQPLQVAQVVAQLLGSDSGVLPAFPAERLAGNMGDHPQARFADDPDLFGFGGGAQAHVGRRGAPAERLHQAARLGFRLCLRLPAKLRQQPAAARR